MLQNEPLLSPGKIGTDGADTFPAKIKTSVDEGWLRPDPVHYVTKHHQQGIESDHSRVKKKMLKVGGAFANRMICLPRSSELKNLTGPKIHSQIGSHLFVDETCGKLSRCLQSEQKPTRMERQAPLGSDEIA